MEHPDIEFPDTCTAKVSADLKTLCHDQSYREDIISQVQSHLPNKSLEALINNAAIQILDPVERLTADNWHTTLDINLVAPFLLIQALSQNLTVGQGSVVNIASIHSILTKPGFVCYATSKAALVGLTKSLSVEFGGRVRINALSPAAISTPMLLDGFMDKPELLKELANMHPIGRIGIPNEVAQAALFLVSKQAGFITGTILDINGGVGNRLHDPV